MKIPIRVHYENGRFIPLEPIPDLKEGEELTTIIVNLDEDSALWTMLASEELLRRDWDTSEEDEAWKHL